VPSELIGYGASRPGGDAAAAKTPDSTGRPRPWPPTGIGHIWTYDFVFDACAHGQQLKCLTVLDEYRRECRAIDAAGGIRSGRAIEGPDAAGQRSRSAALRPL
jgi:hypothetical protein